MRHATRCRVGRTLWREPSSGESCIELEAASGVRIRVFGSGYDLREGDVIDAELGCLEVETDFDTMLRSNTDHERRCEPLGDWDCAFAGKARS